MGRKTYTSDEAISEALGRCHGLVSLAAKAVGLSAVRLHHRIAQSAQLQAAKQGAREATLDLAESKLFSSIGKGKAWAICFFLKTQGKQRGYVERFEHTGSEGDEIRIVKRIVTVNDSRGSAD